MAVSVRQANLIGACIVVLIGVLFIVFSIPIYSSRISSRIGLGEPGAGIFPFWIGVVVAISGLLYLRDSFSSLALGKFMTDSSQQRAALLEIAFSMVAYLAVMPYFGFTLSSFLFLVFYLRVVGKYRFVFSLLFSAVAAGLCAYCFRVWLYLGLPRGFIGL